MKNTWLIAPIVVLFSAASSAHARTTYSDHRVQGLSCKSVTAD